MKSLLVVFDGTHYPQSTLDFALRMHLEEPILLTGVFLPSRDYVEVLSHFYYGNTVTPLFLDQYEDDPAETERNIQRFESFCKQHHISFRVSKKGFYQHIATAIAEETRFSDLMLLGSTRFYENLGNTVQEEYLKDTLHQAECPILLLPETYAVPVQNIIAYDGSAASMYAMKQYAWLLPHFTDLDTHIIYVDQHNKGIPNEVQIHNYAAAHFGSLAFYDLKFEPQKYFNTWMTNEQAPILVCGAYGRSGLSELFHANFALEVIREHKIPVFIAHR